MKKFFKSIGMVLGLPALYMFAIGIVQNIYLQYLLQKNNLPLKAESIEVIKPDLVNNTYVITFVANILMLILLYVIFLATKDGLIKRCNFRKVGLKDITYIAILTIGLSVFTLILANLLTGFFSSYKDVEDTLLQAQSSIFKLIILIVLAPIFEEIFFRGVIFGFLRKNFNVVIAILVQALVFASLHGNIVQGIYTFILGVVLGIIYLYSKSILGCMVSHVVYNFLGVFAIPKLTAMFPGMEFALIIIAVLSLVFAITKMLGKYDSLFQKDSSLNN